MGNAFGKGAGNQAGDDGAAAVAEQGKLLPAQLVGNLHDFGDILPDIVAGIRRAEAALTVTGTVQGDYMQALHMGQHGIKAGGIVEPAMEGDNWYGARGTPLFGGNGQAMDIKGSLTGKVE